MVTETLKIDCHRTPHFQCVCFREARQLVCGWLKLRTDGEKYTYIYIYIYIYIYLNLFIHRSHLACTCILFLSLPPSADTCSHARFLINLFFCFPFPFASASRSLHSHRPSSRRGRAAVGRVRAAIINVSSLSLGGARHPPSPPSLDCCYFVFR